MPLDPNRWTQKTQERWQKRSVSPRAAITSKCCQRTCCWQRSGRTAASRCPSSIEWASRRSRLRNRLEDALAKLPRPYGGSRAEMSRALRSALERAETAQHEMGDEYLSVEHVLLALSDELGVDRDKLLAALREVRGTHRLTSQNPEEAYQSLENYGRDLTDLARKGRLDRSSAVTRRIRRVIQVLSTADQEHPVLIGEPGRR